MYRKGGLGLENVLTTEVMLPLSYLPRDHFLGHVLRQAHGEPTARAATHLVADHAEDALVSVLSAEVSLPGGVTVQPDAIIETGAAYVLVEAKRAGRARFGPEQLAREYLATLQEAGERTPVLLLILGAAPPVTINGVGLREVNAAIAEQLPAVLTRTGVDSDLEELISRIPDVVAWTTWHEIAQIVTRQHEELRIEDPSLRASITRVVSALQAAITVHCPT